MDCSEGDVVQDSRGSSSSQHIWGRPNYALKDLPACVRGK